MLMEFIIVHILVSTSQYFRHEKLLKTIGRGSKPVQQFPGLQPSNANFEQEQNHSTGQPKPQFGTIAGSANTCSKESQIIYKYISTHTDLLPEKQLFKISNHFDYVRLFVANGLGAESVAGGVLT